MLDSTVSDSIASAGRLPEDSTVQQQRPERIIADGGYIQNIIFEYKGGEKHA